MQEELSTSLSLNSLTARLQEAKQAYDLGTPIMTDGEYDRLCVEYYQATGIKWIDLGSLGDVVHDRPMLSLDKAHTMPEVVKSLGAEPVCITPKIDGLGLALRYSADGRFVRAITRGKLVDGVSYGENVTAQALKVQGVSHHYVDLKLGVVPKGHPLEVRGEVYLPVDAFQRINAVRTQEGDEPYKNPRNAAAGVLRSVDSRWHHELKFIAVKVLNPMVAQHDDFTFESEEAMFYWLRDAGFTVPPAEGIELGLVSTESLTAFREEVHATADYETDGVVLTLDPWDRQRSAGVASKYPRYAVAYKFEDQSAETQLRGISWTTSRTGRCVPKYVFDPVELEGATIGFATGHNYANVLKLDAGPGDIVEVFRANQIIPQVRRVVSKNTTQGPSVKGLCPVFCGSCGGFLTIGAVDLTCDNQSCSARLPELLQYAAGRKNLDIDGVGPALAEALVESGLVKDLADFLALGSSNETVMLEVLALAQLELGDKRLGQSAADKLLDGIHKARSKPWNILLHSLGCPGLGEPECRQLTQVYGLKQLLAKSSQDDRFELIAELTKLKGVGSKTAETFCEWLDSNYRWLLRLLDLELGLSTEAMPAAEPVSTQLSGMAVVVTGTLSKPRPVFEQMIVDAGGTVSSSVSKKTTYVLAGAEAGSKLAKAQSLGVQVLDEAAFMALLAEGA